MFFYTNDKKFSLKTAELIGLYVDNYRMFHNQSFQLNPNYFFKVCKEGKVEITLKENDNYDVFDKDGLNVITICGPNGSGKSTLLRMIRDIDALSNTNKTLFLFKDENGNFACTEKSKLSLLTKNGSEMKLSLETEVQGYSQIYAEGDGLFEYEKKSFRTEFIDEYIKNKSIYNLSWNNNEYDGDLFTHFRIRVEKDLLDETRNVLVRKGFTFLEDRPMDEYLIDYPLAFLLIIQYQGSYFNEIKITDEELKEQKFSSVIDIFIKHTVPEKKLALYKKINSKLQDFIWKKQKKDKEFSFKDLPLDSPPKKIYSLKKYTEKKDYKRSIINEIDFFIKDLNLFNGSTDSYITMEPIKLFKDGSIRALYELSDGEYRFIEYRYQLHFAFQKAIERNSCFCWFDEPNNYMHPEWSRIFWEKLIESVRIIRNELNLQKRMSIFVTTHSPFLLSDLFSHNVIVLKDVSEPGSVRNIIATKSEPVFAENIGKLLYKNFSLEKTIGEIAANEIKDCLNNPQKKGREFIISQIADPLLKRLVKAKVENETSKN